MLSDHIWKMTSLLRSTYNMYLEIDAIMTGCKSAYTLILKNFDEKVLFSWLSYDHWLSSS